MHRLFAAAVLAQSGRICLLGIRAICALRCMYALLVLWSLGAVHASAGCAVFPEIDAMPMLPRAMGICGPRGKCTHTLE